MPAEAYQLRVTRSARKDLLDLPPKISGQVERAIDRLLLRLNEGERPQDMKTIHGCSDTYRVDSGEYRISFSLNEQARVFTVVRVRHRKDVYRNS